MISIKIMKIWKTDKYIGIMLDSADCVYFHSFARTIITLVPEGLKKETFNEFKKDIVKCDWDVQKLELNWINKN